MFNAVSSLVGSLLESEPVSVTGRLQPRRSITGTDCVAGETFLTEIKKYR
jgi:hypothetical protein